VSHIAHLVDEMENPKGTGIFRIKLERRIYRVCDSVANIGINRLISFTHAIQKAMNGEDNIEVPKSNVTPEDVNENASHEQTIEQSKTQSENMEVHHHPDLHHKKKNFNEYFLEFLMIFLAVTMGFFAENLREDYVEHKSAKEFASQLIEDLATDTVELNSASHVLNVIITAGDSLGNILRNDAKTITGGKLYYYEYLSSLRWNLLSRDATLQQLKSSGALRYLGDTSLIRKIMNYEESVQVIYLAQNRFEPQKIENWNLAQKVFDHSYFYLLDSFSDSAINLLTMNDERTIRFMNNNYPLLTYDKNLLQQLRNWAYSSSRNYRIEIRIFNAAKLQAIIAINALKKEYNF
jgi:hypothetical protein